MKVMRDVLERVVAIKMKDYVVVVASQTGTGAGLACTHSVGT